MIERLVRRGGYGRSSVGTIIPLWDPHLAAAKVPPCAGQGVASDAFLGEPVERGLPSMHTGSVGSAVVRIVAQGDRDTGREQARGSVVPNAHHRP